jgi:hypothetical protein
MKFGIVEIVRGWKWKMNRVRRNEIAGIIRTIQIFSLSKVNHFSSEFELGPLIKTISSPTYSTASQPKTQCTPSPTPQLPRSNYLTAFEPLFITSQYPHPLTHPVITPENSGSGGATSSGRRATGGGGGGGGMVARLAVAMAKWMWGDGVRVGLNADTVRSCIIAKQTNPSRLLMSISPQFLFLRSSHDKIQARLKKDKLSSTIVPPAAQNATTVSTVSRGLFKSRSVAGGLDTMADNKSDSGSESGSMVRSSSSSDLSSKFFPSIFSS